MSDRMFDSPARDGFFPPKKSDGGKARVASILIFFFRGKECNTHQHPLDAPPGGIGRAMMSSLRFSISQNASCMWAIRAPTRFGKCSHGVKKSQIDTGTLPVLFSHPNPCRNKQVFNWALKVRWGKIVFFSLQQGPVGCAVGCVFGPAWAQRERGGGDVHMRQNSALAGHGPHSD